MGELLVRENLISLSQLQKAQEEQRKTGARLGYSLTKLGILDEQELTNFLSKQYGVPSINLADFEISPDVLQLVPAGAGQAPSAAAGQPRRRDADRRDVAIRRTSTPSTI